MMIASWWWAWVLLMILFLVTPVGYGWGYRGWGAPVPRYIQRRRGSQALVAPGSPAFDHHAWGWGGDYVWVMMLLGVVSAAAAFLWR